MSVIKQKIVTRKPSDKFSFTVDGVFGGIVSNGNINMNFYTESVSIPSETLMTIDEDGKIIDTDNSSDYNHSTMVREIVSSISFDIHKAKAFHIWLGQMIDNADFTKRG